MVALSEAAESDADFAALNALLDKLGDRAEASMSWQKVRANVVAAEFVILKALAAKPPRDRAAEAVADQSVTDGDQHERHKERVKVRQRDRVRSARDIGGALREAMLTVDAARREGCRFNFRRFCETYAPEFFNLGWSPAHLLVIARLETAVLKGGLFAVAMPRGSGKTTLSIVAVVWAVLYGHRESVVLFGATKEAAVELMTIIKAIIEGEDYPELVVDFPEACLPAEELEDKAIMAKGQRCEGKSTRMKWDADRITLARLDGSECSGACIRTRGLSGHLRGLVHKSRGRLVRPDLVILDDPQTDESAMSLEETKKRLKTIEKGVRGLAGPGKRIAGIMPCTVIEPDDVADKILSGSPGWSAERIPMIADFDGVPEETADRWEELREIYWQEMNGEEYPQTNKYYCENRVEMDAGLVHYWPERIEAGFVSAIQHAICWYMTRPESFWSEAMQQPKGEDDPDADLLSVEEIQHKQHGAPEGTIPAGGEVLVSFIDVQHSLLFYCVMAWNPKDFSGYVIEYGAWPKQRTRNFALSQARPRLADAYKGRRGSRLGLENVIRQGLTDCLDYLFAKEFRREDGQLIAMDRAAVDCSDGKLSVHLREVIAEVNNPRVMAAFGRDAELTGKPKPGDKKGDRWRARNDDYAAIRKLTYQPNYWKQFFHARLATDYGEPGSVSLFADEHWTHKTFAEHLRAENRTIKRVRTQDGEEVVQEFKNPPGAQNHWFDCVVACGVLAAHEGVALWARVSGKRKAKVKLSDVRKARRA